MIIGNLILIVFLILGYVDWIARGLITKKWNPLNYTFLEFMLIIFTFAISVFLTFFVTYIYWEVPL